MTEYDYSPEAYERYLATHQRISKWVATTEGYRNEYGNALAVPPSQTSSHSQPRGQLLGPVETPLRSSQSQYFPPQSSPRSQSRLASSCQRSAADIHYQYLQHSTSKTSPRSPAPSVPSRVQHPRTASRHASSTNLHTTPSQPPDVHTSRTSSTYVAASRPQKQQLTVPSQHASIVPEVHGQHLQDANAAHASQRSIIAASQKSSLRHHASTPQLEIAPRQTPPAYMVTIPPSDKPTYVYAPSGWVPSAGLVIVPSKGQSTSIVISPPGPHAHIAVPQVQSKGYIQPATPAAVSPYSSLTTLQTSPHASSSQAIYPPTTYVPMPVVIIERERRSKSAGGKKSKKKEKRNRSKARS